MESREIEGHTVKLRKSERIYHSEVVNSRDHSIKYTSTVTSLLFKKVLLNFKVVFLEPLSVTAWKQYIDRNLVWYLSLYPIVITVWYDHKHHSIQSQIENFSLLRDPPVFVIIL